MANMGRGRKMAAVVALAALLGAAMVPPAMAEEDDHRFATDFGLGVGAFFTNLVYMPVKFVYATLGGITGGFAYVLTGFNYGIAKSVWVPSTGGDYVITPSMLKGEDPIYFSGTTQPKQHEHSAREEEDLPAGNGAAGTKY